VITSRQADGTLTIVADDTTNFVVVLTEATKVRQINGIRRAKMGTPALIPGLRIDAEGEWDTSNRFVAEEVNFTRTDFRTARAILAGLVPTDQRVAANTAAIDVHSQQIALGAQKIDQLDRQIAETDQKIVATTGKLDARISELGSYNVISTITVHFRNNKATIDRAQMEQLQQFAAQAKGTPAFMVQVSGFASAVGPEARNQTLSRDRAVAVTAVLQQSGVSSTNILLPAAMGTTDQVASNKTKDGQAENRRAVIQLLQNKGIAGQ
jgi:outer membrane protein OmpA-like peptidoglycan-associated protein